MNRAKPSSGKAPKDSDKHQRAVSRPKAADFSAGAVERAIWSEALQHPLTLFPGALAILGGVYMGLISLDKTSFAVTLGSALVSLGSVVYNYFIRGEDLAREHVDRLKAQRLLHKEREAGTMIEVCRQLGFQDGEQAVRELRGAYLKLKKLLGERAGQPGTQRFLVLAEDCYHEGLDLLSAALDSYRVLEKVDFPKLERELRACEAEALALNNRVQQGEAALKPRWEAVQTRIETYRRRLELFDKRRDAFEGLMAQCEVLEAAMESAYLEVVDLVGGKTLLSGDPATKLERAVEAARVVEDWLRGMGGSPEEDAFYREAGQRAMEKKNREHTS